MSGALNGAELPRSAGSSGMYAGKRFSVLGDSISTLESFVPSGYSVFYTAEKCAEAQLLSAQDTWWGRVIDHLGGELLVNNSWSGSRVSQLPGQEELFPSGCSGERTGQLHIQDIKPDVIIVYLGFNDWGYGVPLHCPIIPKLKRLCYFDSAYKRMLDGLKKSYPHAEIWCCTLNPTTMYAKPAFRFPEAHGGTHIEKYNQIIRTAAKAKRCNVADLYSYRTPNDTIDGSHPTAEGMRTLAELIARSMTGGAGRTQ